MMIVANIFNEFRQQVLMPEGLDDLSRFLRGDFFDEIPLYSRYKQIEPFIRRREGPDEFLLGIALEYLSEICNEARSIRGFVAAITISDDKDSRYIVPNVFICKGQMRRRLQGLRLRKPLTAFGKRIARVLKRVDPRSEFVILEDTLTVPGEPRMFISTRDMFNQLVSAAEPSIK